MKVLPHYSFLCLFTHFCLYMYVQCSYSENSVSDHLFSAGNSLIRPVLYSPDRFSHWLPMYQQPLLHDQLLYSELRAVASDHTVTLPAQYDHLTSATRDSCTSPSSFLYPTLCTHLKLVSKVLHKIFIEINVFLCRTSDASFRQCR